MRRFAILRHHMPPDSVRSSHWDLLFDVGETALKTWAIHDAPDLPTPQSALQLPDHRLVYLDFEGPLDRDRGEVSQWDTGMCRVLTENAHVWQFLLMGERMRGSATLRFERAKNEWAYQFTPSD
jgi:hypothetical protein